MLTEIDWLRLFPFLILTVAVVALAHRFCHAALVAQERGHPAAGLLACARGLSLISTGLWIIWLVLVLWLDPWRTIHQPGSSPLQFFISNGFTLLLPAIILAYCDWLTWPVVKKVRGLELSPKSYLIDCFIGRLLLPLACGFCLGPVR